MMQLMELRKSVVSQELAEEYGGGSARHSLPPPPQLVNTVGVANL